MTVPVGARVHVADNYYAGVAVVLEYDPLVVSRYAWAGPYYCHLLDLCAHRGRDEACDDPKDECMGDWCRGWYALADETPAARELG